MLILLIICAIAGAVGGLLQGMVGVGIGIIVIPLLTFMLPHYGVPSDLAIRVALATSMAAISISSLSAVIAHHRHENIRWNVIKKMVIFSMLGSGIGALLASYMPARALEIIFGLFMFYTAFRMMIKKKDGATEIQQASLSLPIMAGGGLLIGITASIVGIGGGLFMVPFLHSRGLPMRYAVGTSTVVGLPVAIIGAVTYIITGFSQFHQNPVMLGYVHWPAFVAICVTAIVSAALGAKLAKSVNPIILQRLFAVCIVIVGTKMLY